MTQQDKKKSWSQILNSLQNKSCNWSAPQKYLAVEIWLKKNMFQCSLHYDFGLKCYESVDVKHFALGNKNP